MPAASQEPFVILVDQREKLPYDFVGMRCVIPYEVEPTFMETGDYQVLYPDDVPDSERIVVERKSLSDLYSTVGQNRDRFIRELERMSAFGHAVIVIEATLEMVANPAPYLQHPSLLNPRSVTSGLIAWQQRYGINVVFAGNRELGEKVTYRILERWVRDRGLQRKAPAASAPVSEPSMN